MTKLFTQILQMSISAGYVILAILLFRLLLKKAPKKYSYALWSAAAFRLLCPYSISSVVSLFNIHFGGKERPAVDLTGVTAATGSDIIAVDTGIPVISQMIRQVTDVGASVPVNETIGETIVSVAQEIAPVQQVISPVDIIAWIWVTGVIALYAYGLISYVKLQRKMRMSMPLRDNIRQAYIRTPFILGFIKPTIYIPFDLEPMVENISISHERCHIHRGDHIVKLLSYLILIIHWFNPLCWLAYFEMGKDMEMSVDEYVLSHYRDISRSYSTALLSFSTGKRFALASPLAFGERNVKERIVNAMKFKNATRFVSVIAAVMCILVLVACGTNGNPNTEPDSKEEISPTPNDTETETVLINPLTGFSAEEIIRPVGITIKNIRTNLSDGSGAYPIGFSDADILIEYVAVTGEHASSFTRYIALCSDYDDLEEIGGVTASTLTEPAVLSSFDILSVHFGYHPEMSEEIAESYAANNVSELNLNPLRQYSFRNTDMSPSENSFMTSGENLLDYMKDSALPAYDDRKTFLNFALETDEILLYNSVANVGFALTEKQFVEFDYDISSKQLYKKEPEYILGGDGSLAECIDRKNGNRVQFDNVIILYVKAQEGPVDSLIYDFSSGGEGYYYTRGTSEAITWEKGTDHAFELYGTNNDRLSVNCGKTYIALIPVE